MSCVNVLYYEQFMRHLIKSVINSSRFYVNYLTINFNMLTSYFICVLF